MSDEVQGIPTDSKQELWIAQALRRLDIPFQFQVPILGGREVRGGYVIDFVVYAPFARALEHFGNYWHRGQLGNEDRLKIAILDQMFEQPTIILWESDCMTPEQTFMSVKEKLL